MTQLFVVLLHIVPYFCNGVLVLSVGSCQHELRSNISLYNQLGPWSWVLLEKPVVAQLVKKSSAFYGTWKFITLFQTTRNLSLTWARWMQPTTSHPISLKYHPDFTFPSVPRCSKCCLPFSFSDQNFVWICLLFHACYFPPPISSYSTSSP
jgi:hypothetical protein